MWFSRASVITQRPRGRFDVGSDIVSVPRQLPLAPRRELGALGLIDATSNDNDWARLEIAPAQSSVVIRRICRVMRSVCQRLSAGSTHENPGKTSYQRVSPTFLGAKDTPPRSRKISEANHESKGAGSGIPSLSPLYPAIPSRAMFNTLR